LFVLFVLFLFACDLWGKGVGVISDIGYA
jgi:hypothetical protein